MANTSEVNSALIQEIVTVDEDVTGRDDEENDAVTPPYHRADGLCLKRHIETAGELHIPGDLHRSRAPMIEHLWAVMGRV